MTVSTLISPEFSPDGLKHFYTLPGASMAATYKSHQFLHWTIAELFQEASRSLIQQQRQKDYVEGLAQMQSGRPWTL